MIEDFNWFTVGTDTEITDTEAESVDPVEEAELHGDNGGGDDGKGEGDNGEAIEDMGDD